MRLIDADALKELLIDTLESIKKNPKMDGQEAHIIAACHMLTEMIDDASTVSTARNGWISVKDRLPEDEQEVLVIAHGWDGRLVYVGRHKRVEAQKSWLTGITNKSSEWSLWGWSYLKEPMVTHWMPLPEPPEEKERKDGDGNV